MRLTFNVYVTDAALNPLTRRKALYLRITRDFFIQVQQKNLSMLQRLTDETLNKEPRSVVRPLQWQSLRQKRHVIAKLRKQGNLPYRRTGRIRKWKAAMRQYNISQNQGAFALLITNETPYAKYVYGDRQQPFHANTGWPSASNFATGQALQETIPAIMRTWKDLALPGGVAR